MKLIVGLGNPGLKYKSTRHNIGFKAVGLLAKKYNIKIDKLQYGAKIGKGFINNHKVILALPQKFMNLSGESVGWIIKNEKINKVDLLVVCDDVNLKYGTLRLRKEGSAGGHNGLKSIIEHLGGGDFARLRVGIGYEGISGDITDFVLGNFTKEENVSLADILDKAVEGCENWI